MLMVPFHWIQPKCKFMFEQLNFFPHIFRKLMKIQIKMKSFLARIHGHFKYICTQAHFWYVHKQTYARSHSLYKQTEIYRKTDRQHQKKSNETSFDQDKANFVNVLEQLVYFAEQCFFGFPLCEFLLGQTCSGAQVSEQYRIHIVSHAIVQFSFIHDNLHLRMAI